MLINTEPENEHEVYNKLSEYSRIIEIKPLFREYDLIAKIKMEKKEDFGRYISKKIRSINGVINTKIIQ